MTQGKARVHRSQSDLARKPGRSPGWQRALFGLYSVIFAFVLPMICWGAYAAPGHPHRLPHWVFADPIITDPIVADPSPTTATAHHQHGATEPADATKAPVTPAQPKGRASLSLLLFSILTLVFLALWTLARIDQRYRVMLFLAPRAQSITLPILLPPPRPAPFAR